MLVTQFQDERNVRYRQPVVASHRAVPVHRFARVVHDAERLVSRRQSFEASGKIDWHFRFYFSDVLYICDTFLSGRREDL